LAEALGIAKRHKGPAGLARWSTNDSLHVD
jgi:hypothetical protein